MTDRTPINVEGFVEPVLCFDLLGKGSMDFRSFHNDEDPADPKTWEFMGNCPVKVRTGKCDVVYVQSHDGRAPYALFGPAYAMSDLIHVTRQIDPSFALHRVGSDRATLAEAVKRGVPIIQTHGCKNPRALEPGEIALAVVPKSGASRHWVVERVLTYPGNS